MVGASIISGESAGAADSGFEEIVTGTIPVSDGSGVVEQGVQGQAHAIDQQGFTGEGQGSRDRIRCKNCRTCQAEYRHSTSPWADSLLVASFCS